MYTTVHVLSVGRDHVGIVIRRAVGHVHVQVVALLVATDLGASPVIGQCEYLHVPTLPSIRYPRYPGEEFEAITFLLHRVVPYMLDMQVRIVRIMYEFQW